jgi:glycosyltransferase involved in cell wall biosynthesis
MPRPPPHDGTPAAYSRRVPSVDVLHVCFGGVGGHRTVVTTLATALAARGLSTGVIGVAPPGDLLGDRADWPGVAEVAPVPVLRRADLTSMAGAYQAARRLPARALVIHSARHAAPVLAGLRSVGARGPVVTREGHSRALLGRALLAQSAVAIGLSDATVFLTAESRDGYPLARLPLRGLRRRRVIPNGLVLPDARPRRGADAVAVLGMAGRLVPGKDLGSVIRAVALLRADGHAVSLRVAGDGPEREAWVALARDVGAADAVEFAGSLPEAAMPAWFAGLDAYVHATDGEGFSNALLGAAAAGLPIVASDVAGVHDVFTDGRDAVLVPPRDPEALADAVQALRSDPARAAALAAAAHRLVVERYSADRMADAYLALLEELDPSGPWAGARRPLATTT